MDYPLINGVAYSFAEMSIKIGSFKTIGFKSLNFSESLEAGAARGTGQRKLAMTPGDLDADASLEMFMADWLELLELLGDGYMRKVFPIHTDFSNEADVHSVDLKGCRIKKVDDSHSQGTEPLTVKLDLYVMGVKRDGYDALGADVP